MKVNVIIGAEHLYACIKGDDYSMDVKLIPHCGAAYSLRKSAAEIDLQIERLIRRAIRLRQAADILEPIQ